MKRIITIKIIQNSLFITVKAYTTFKILSSPLKNFGLTFISRLRPGKLCETPSALVRLWRGPASRGVVGAEGEKPSATRLGDCFFKFGLSSHPHT
jgi:hypothetical protein